MFRAYDIRHRKVAVCSFVTRLELPPPARANVNFALFLLGNIFSIEQPNQLKAHRTICIVSRSSSENIFERYADLSAPTPCSPVIDPPASMQ